MKQIPLTQGKVALVDDDDYEWLSQWKWCADNNRHTRYAYRKKPLTNVTIRMHREILNAPPGQHVDHKNGNGLDNRRCNLRLCSRSENARNMKRPRHNTSGYKGVCWHFPKSAWVSSICVNGKRHHLGYFPDKYAAARAYNRAAKELCGDFACLN